MSMVARQGSYSPQAHDIPATLEFVLAAKGLHGVATYTVLDDVLKRLVDRSYDAISPIIEKVCDQIKAIGRGKEDPLGPFFQKYIDRAVERWGGRVFVG
ncbi:hypothetical protein P0D75_34480 [Paraburkholderia sediminicola]|uniref:hypothetical protein n=1 Tax=Paraburkholderia sediminicola TaxID=458836 RepID=UPI0038BDA851